MKTIKQKYKIKAPIEKVWQALTDPRVINKWGGGPAKMDGKKGTKFKLWGGDIYGINTKIMRNKELSQDWFQKGWENPSKVIFKLSAKGKQTQLILIHKNVPDKDVTDVEEGWKEYYLGPLQSYLE